MFGMPDIGGLIFKKDISERLFTNRKYFGGGTVDAVSGNDDFNVFKTQLHSVIEDGTLPMHSILQLSIAIDTHLEIFGSFENTKIYTHDLTEYMLDELRGLIYKNGNKMVEVYDGKTENRGPIVAFSLLDELGSYSGYYNFEQVSSLQCISLRTGTVCNPGGVQKILGRTTKDIVGDYKKGHKCGDRMDIMNGKPTGVIRVSVGAMTLKSEINCLIQSIRDFMETQKTSCSAGSVGKIAESEIKIQEIVVYPLKSCRGYSVPRGVKWPITENGMLYDREFVLLNLLDE
ncbi:unnamed protein product [Ambrosiozyma monospora]|uniref:Unnamed protein product n=1 Tax=Ambrosiozyma monospora TaxID=43982 RepID=A0ACB5UAS3_AMBMO|nr:unnamed protein product [Ambrosiozyma monospora]